MKSRQYLRSSTSGLTLIELLIALGISSLIIGLVLPLLLGHQRLVKVDQARTSVYQNLRSAMELVGTDVRIAGERLEQRGGPNIFPIEIIAGEEGEPDELILRRNLLDYTLPVCDNINAGSSENNINVRQVGNNPPWNSYGECQGHPNQEVPPELLRWREYRDNHGGEVRVYIYDPNNQQGEFFVYDHDDQSNIQVHRESGSWENDYGVDNNSSSPQNLPRLYVLEEKRYRLNTQNNILEMIVNGNEDDKDKIVGGITDFQVRAIMDDGSEQETVSSWRSLKAIQIYIESVSEVQNETVERNLVSRFFPRNILSDR